MKQHFAHFRARFGRRLTYANVVSTLALIGVIAGGGGAAYALGVNTVGSPQIKNGQVKTVDLQGQSVNVYKLQKDAVQGWKVKDGSLSAADLHPKTEVGLAEAGVNVSPDGTLTSWFNRMGGEPLVVKGGDGSYSVNIPGTSATNTTVMASANAEGSDYHCEMWNVGAGGGLSVRCRLAADGTLTDVGFQLVLHKS